jgi:hypothetical protein
MFSWIKGMLSQFKLDGLSFLRKMLLLVPLAILCHSIQYVRLIFQFSTTESSHILLEHFKIVQVELYRGTGQALNLTVSKLWPNTTLYFELAYVFAWGTVGTPSDVLIVNTNQAVWLNGSFV